MPFLKLRKVKIAHYVIANLSLFIQARKILLLCNLKCRENLMKDWL